MPDGHERMLAFVPDGHGRRSHVEPRLTGPALTRRAALVVLAGLGVAACTATPDGSSSTSASPDADQALRSQVADDEWTLVALYDSAIAAQPSLAATLAPWREQHVEHALALGSPAASASESASASASASMMNEPLTVLAEAERAAASSRTAACGSAADSGLARLLASVAASEASHAVALLGVRA